MYLKSKAFIINCQLERQGGTNMSVAPRCISCGLVRYKIIADNTKLRLTCNRCGYDLYYMRIDRNDIE